MSGVRRLVVAFGFAGILFGASAPPGAATTPRAIIPLATTPLPGPVLRAAAAGSTAIVAGRVGRTSLAQDATYRVRAWLDVAARHLRGWVEITTRNRSGAGIDRVELNTVLAPLGGLRLGSVTVDGRRVHTRINDQTIVVPLDGVLPDGATAVIRVPFRATLQRGTSGSSWLFSRSDGVVAMYRWIPWISRRTPFERPNHGDPFVTPVSARVRLTITTDVPMQVATTGTRISISADGRTQAFEATDVRDMTTAMARDYRSRSTRVGDTIVRVYTRPGFASGPLLGAASRALRMLEARLGPYPYPVLRIVQTAGGYGMEGPGVAWIPADAPRANLPYLVAHEVAHQWFYGIVGNDQARDPFADEAMADFAARFVLGLRRAPRCPAAPVDRPIYRYSASCYYEDVYIRGGNLIDDARRSMGSDRFWRAIRGYLAEHRWGITDTRTLLAALDDATPLDLASRWRSSFAGIR